VSCGKRITDQDAVSNTELGGSSEHVSHGD